MASQGELPSPTLLRNVVHVDSFNVPFVKTNSNVIYDMHEEPFEDLECRTIVSSMVQASVVKGFLKALEEDFHTQLADKDKQIEDLRHQLKEKDAIISDIGKLGLRTNVDGADKSMSETLWNFLQESQKKWKESEDDIIKKERELEHMASSMVQMASMLENEMGRVQIETKRANELDNQLAELKEQETRTIEQIASMQQEIGKIRIDNSRLRRQARLKEQQFNESIVYAREEMQQKQLQLEKFAQERQALEKSLREKDKALSDLENDYQGLESQLRSGDERLQSLLMERNNLQETVEGQKLMQELLVIYIEQQIKEMRENLKCCILEGNKVLKSQQSSETLHFSSCDGKDDRSVDGMQELIWKGQTEATIFEMVIESWYKEVPKMLHKLTFELALKDELIFKCDQHLEGHKQAIEELENDYATLMSICLALLRDQNDNDVREEPTNIPTHEFGKRKLMELSELLSSRDASGVQVVTSSMNLQFEEKLSSNDSKCVLVPNNISDQEISTESHCINDLPVLQGERKFPELQMEEEHVSQQLRQMLELEIISEILMQKYKQSLSVNFDLRTFPSNDKDTVESIIKKSFNNFEDLEAQIESFLELESSRLERMRSSCSTSIAKCEFKLQNLTKRLADQITDIKVKISFVQEAFKEQEWKHMVQDDIFVWVLSDALMQKRQKMEDSNQHTLYIETKASKPLVNFNYSLDWIDSLDSPKISEDHHAKLPNEGKKSTCSKIPDSPSGIQDKDKLILVPKTVIEDLRKEKIIVEQKLEAITEEIYSLKRQFWKEKEIWVSKLSQPQRKDVEAQVEALSRHSPKSHDFENELKKLEMAMFEDLISDSKKEWFLEKENLFNIISRKEVEIENLTLELSRFRAKEQNRYAKQADLLAEISDLKIQIDNLSYEILNKEFQFAKCKELWHAEKECIKREVHELLEREKTHIRSSHCLSGRVAALETDIERLRLDRLDHVSSFLILEREWQSEREDLRGRVAQFLEKEHTDAALQDHLSGRIAELEAQIAMASLEKLDEVSSLKELQTERDNLKGEVEILLQREQAYAVLEGHLLANLAEFETLIETSHLERLDQEFSFTILEREWKSERDDLRGQIRDFVEKEHSHAALQDQLSGKIAELEAQIDMASLEKLDAVCSLKELRTERDNIKGEVEILLQREQAYAVLEGHLLANLTELETLIETARLERLAEETSFSILERKWQSEREDLRGRVTEFIEKEHSHAALQDHLSGRIAELQAQIDMASLESFDAEASFKELQTERDNLKEEVEILLKRESAYAVLEGHLLANLAELETLIETSHLERLAEESSFLITERERQSEREDLRGQVTEFIEKEHAHNALQGNLLGRIAELEVQIDELCLEKHNSMSSFRELQMERDNLRREVDILLQREHSHAVVEGHLIANVAELEILVEMSCLENQELQKERENVRVVVQNLIHKEHAYDILEGHLLAMIVELEVEIEGLRQTRHDQESLFMSMKRELQNENVRLTTEIRQLIDKESVWSATHNGLLATIAKLGIELETSKLDNLDQVSSLSTLKQDWEAEKVVLIREIEKLTEREHSHTVSVDHLSVKIAEMEAEMENARVAKLDQESLFVKFKEECEMDKERLLAEIGRLLEREHAYSLSQDQLLAHVEALEIEVKRLKLARLDCESSLLELQQAYTIEREKCLEMSSEREETMAELFALRKKEISNAKIINRPELENDQKYKLKDLKTKLESVPKQLELTLSEKIGQFLQSSHEMEKKIVDILHKRSLSLDGIEKICHFLNGRIKSFATMEAQYKQKLASNLQKAETEVDLLGDEVEALLGILEEVQIAFDIYAPVLHHYPKMTEVAKLVKHEIQLRIDPKYGA